MTIRTMIFFMRAKPLLHELLIPFHELFQAEREKLYSICKEILDGLGLVVLARCNRISDPQVDNTLSYYHARSSRTVLFNISCAMIIQLKDMVVTGDATAAEAVKRCRTQVLRKRGN